MSTEPNKGLEKKDWKTCFHQFGQRYDERRGCGNGAQFCFGCQLTLDELIEKHRQASREEVISRLPEKYEEGEYSKKDKKWVEGWNACVDQKDKNLDPDHPAFK